ncbi:SDR family NAD(P)-dependent oxidoreductase [Solimonas sp. K1W22B-7]|uniref:SDR family NAD(P)-dependent oxidoreductase n=1 Tax=Solimonas sp. K1W22B-7 TaxID=2303331 RepID=UPI000E32FDD5|nr:SDR family NAD(P)-dependent oxidoreductase [Solimonas sp. K1W22B-7]AXQ31297.1 SDR family NAD(P)-dependent oxidoreductase [Solimonas sp. K1W22B-7]
MPLPIPRDPELLRGRTALVTGGAGGLGHASASRLLALGAGVLLADINAEAGEQAAAALRARHAGAEVGFQRVDLSDLASVRELAAACERRWPRLDLLLNNAGIYPPAQRMQTSEGWELSLAISLIGPQALTLQLLPLLERGGSSRVVTITSLVQSQGRIDFDDPFLKRVYRPIDAYRQSKLAALAFAVELQRRLAAAGSSVSSLAAHPGVCRTQLGANRRRQASDSWLQGFKADFFAYTQRRFGQEPEQAADSVVVALCGQGLPPAALVGPGGWLQMAGAPVLLPPNPLALDASFGARLWTLAQDCSGCRWP